MGLWQDFQFAIRLLIKDKWFTLVAAVALALGIGVNTTVFTFVNAVLIRGLPFENPDQIMALGSFDPVRDRDMGVSYLDFKDWSAATRTFTGMAAYTGATMNVSDQGRAPDRYSGTLLSASAFRLLHVTPASAAISCPRTIGRAPPRWCCSVTGSGRTGTAAIPR